MGKAPNAVVALRDGDRKYWVEVRTAEVVRQVSCHKCRKFFAVLWLQVNSISNIVTRVPIRPARKWEQDPPTEEVRVSEPIISRAIELEVRQMLDRPANVEHGIVTKNGWCCNNCLELVEA